MNKPGWMNSLFAACCALLVIVPLYFNTAMANKVDNFFKSFETEFSNAVGFRKGFIDFHDKLLSKITHFYYAAGAPDMKGKEGHHFFVGAGAENGTGFMVGKYQGVQTPAPEIIGEAAGQLNKMADYLHSHGIPFVLLLCPDKESVYPEFYPDTIYQLYPENSYLDTIADGLRGQTALDEVLNAKGILLEHKDEYLLYNKRHDVCHYNNLGAYFTYQALMDCLSQKRPGLQPLPLEAFDLQYMDMHFDLIPELSPRAGRRARRVDDQVLTGTGLPSTNWHNQAYTTGEEALPNIVVFRDSFSGGYTNLDTGYIRDGQPSDYTASLLTGLIPGHFNNTYFIHYDNISLLEKCVEAYQPDIVVLQAGERAIPGMMEALRAYAPQDGSPGR